MDWNAFIVPVVFILVELIKLKIKDKSWLPHIAVVLGMALGAAYAVYFKHDLFVHILSLIHIYRHVTAVPTVSGRARVWQLSGPVLRRHRNGRH